MKKQAPTGKSKAIFNKIYEINILNETKYQWFHIIFIQNGFLVDIYNTFIQFLATILNIYMYLLEMSTNIRIFFDTIDVRLIFFIRIVGKIIVGLLVSRLHKRL